jgi:hypothetical protein
MNPFSLSKRALVALACAVALGVVGFLLRQAGLGPGPGLPQSSMGTNPAAKPGETMSKSAASALAQAVKDLRQQPGSAKSTLAALRRDLLASGLVGAAAAILTFLDSKQDAATGLGFIVAGDGTLTEAPTLRVFLLDLLGQSDPAAAAACAGIILSSKDFPDEWALALRHLARGNASTEGRALLEQKVGELLRHEAWQQNPSSGYLEAFDAAVFLGGTNLLAPLATLVRKQNNPTVAHAAFLALDRLVINDAAATLGALRAGPDLMQGREATRANYFARADVQDSRQREVLERYLLDTRIGVAELDQFAGLYPSANYMISHNLLTHPATADGRLLAARDAASLRVLEEWSADPRFARLKPQLEKARRRLANFVRQQRPAR